MEPAHGVPAAVLREFARGPAAAECPRLHPWADKRRGRTCPPAGRRAVRLGRVVVLAPGAPPEKAILGHQEALIELLRHSYGACSLSMIRTADHMRQCARVVT